ncbi:MAG: hypothetical protein CSA50_07105 [Gammaproteobacteria bacterium]|nr:MAG: hypothetical protein CSA50_07105 [Gammaproteobacteria bacterium]
MTRSQYSSSSSGSVASSARAPSYEFIDSQDRFNHCLSLCLGSEFVSIDTEFVRTNTFYSNPGLFQVAVADSIFLIDPLAIQDLSLLADLLSSTKTKKIMHAMGEDIDLFKHSLKILPNHVFDTQIAAALIGIGPSIGYANLVNHVLSLELDKGETRSNWLQRPLTDKQKHYAANDVFYLAKIYPQLLKQLERLEREGIVEEECQRLIGLIDQAGNTDLYYLKIRGAWRLTRHKQFILKSLCSWRERTAMDLNKPRARILPDAVLQTIVEKMPSDLRQLYIAAHQNPQTVRQFGEEILEIIHGCAGISDDCIEAKRDGDGKGVKTSQDKDRENMQLIMAPLTSQQQGLHKKLKSVVRTVAQQSGFLPEMLGNGRVLEEMVSRSWSVADVYVPSFYQGWRWPRVGQRLQTVVRQYLDENQSGISGK